MMLHVNDISVILDRNHDRDYERTIEIYQLCDFPHILFVETSQVYLLR